jgi:ankyrin repeat protein
MRAPRRNGITLAAWVGFASIGAAAGDVRLIQAVKSQDPTAIGVLLKQGVDVNATQPDGATALHWAAYHDDQQTTDLLVRAGANVNVRNDLGATPLWLAAIHGGAAVVERLLSAGADANVELPSGETPLMTAARAGSLQTVISLLTHGADVNAKERVRGQNALMWAVAEHHPEVVAALLAHHADVRARSEARSRLVNAGADGTQRLSTDRANLFEEEHGGFTPLLFAAQRGDLDSAKLLIDAGANANDTAPNGASALVIATHSGHQALAAFLIETGADPNAAGAGYAPLHAAILRADQVLMKSLLAHGANPNAVLTRPTPVRRASQDWAMNPAWVGATPIWLAARFADAETMRTLATAGADGRFTMPDGGTVLMAPLAVGPDRRRGVGVAPPDPAEAERNALSTMKVAVELGAEVNARNAAGDTALHGAASRRYTSVIQFLADSGARLDVKNKRGQTPLSIVMGARRPQDTAGDQTIDAAARSTVDLLRKLGADQ